MSRYIDPNLKLDLLTQNVILGDGGVEFWPSGVGEHIFSQATSANRPQFQPDMGLTFDGSNDFLSLYTADSPIFDLGVGGNPFTLAFTLTGATSQFMTCTRSGGVDTFNSTTGHQYYFYYFTNGTIYWRWWNGSAMSDLNFAQTLTAGTYYDIEISYDGGTTRAYVNGVYKASLVGNYAKPSSAAGFVIARNSVASYLYAGSIKSISIYDKALHASNTDFIPAARLGRYPRNPVRAIFPPPRMGFQFGGNL